MKKVALFILIIALAGILLTACGDPVVPGSAWADKETLTFVAYNVTDTERESPLFTMTAVTENLQKGSHALSTNPDKTYVMSSSARRYTLTAVDPSGKTVMYSESLMNVFVPVAAHKEVDFGNKKYSYDSEYADKTLSYTLNKNGETSKGSISTGDKFIDNELLYTYIRTYSSAEQNLNSSLTVVDVYNEQRVDLNVQTFSTGETTLAYYTAEPKKKVKSSRVQISRSSSPVGYPILIDYSQSSGENPFVFKSNNSNSESKRIPLQITENDIIYYLTSVAVD